MSALHSVKKRMRHLGASERKALDRRIVSGVYSQSLREIDAAKQRLARRDPDL